MNTLKPLLIFAALVGVCYGVYSRINHKPDSPPPEALEGWDVGLNVENGMAQPGPPSGFGAPSQPHSAETAHGTPLMIPGQSGPYSAHDPAHAHDPHSPDYGSGGPPGSAGWGSPPAGPPGANYGGGPNDPYASQPPVGGADPAGNYGRPADPYGAPPDGAYAPNGDPGAMQGAMGPGGMGSGGMGPGAFAIAVEQAKLELDEGRLPAAHSRLSRLYDDASLSPTEQDQLNRLLDQLAGTVIYSTQALLEPPCEVQPGETLERIAQRYRVPWKLLAKINGIDDQHALRPGERLKAVSGPFSAVVSLEKRTLTLMLNNAYAGRFPIGVGREHPPIEGQYVVTEKVVDPTYYGPGRVIEHGDRENPLGRRWIGLGEHIGIHGTNDPHFVGRTDLAGSISLSDRDIDDVFDILSENSVVVIRR